jgi:4-hydroxybutyrate dehydrogenase
MLSRRRIFPLKVQHSCWFNRIGNMSIIQYLNRVQLGHGAVRLVGEECQKLGITKPLIVTDKGIRAAGILDIVLEHLRMPQAVIYDETPFNPTEGAVRDATNLYRANQCDGVVAIGGGSSMDCAKGVALMTTHSGVLSDYTVVSGGSMNIRPDVAPLVAVPTTSGTGSEVSRGAIIILDDHRKTGISNFNLLPKTAICDPELTLGLPKGLTAGTGMDALAHCIETFFSSVLNPVADSLALGGLTCGWSHIERATHDGSDKDARLQMMTSSILGAMAFQKGLGCVHSLSHALGGMNPKLHHGTLNAIFLPAVLEFNASDAVVQAERKMERMADSMKLGDAGDVPDALRRVNESIGIPKGLSELGVTRDMFDAAAAAALADPSHRTNPREASASDYKDLLEKSF